MEWFKVFYWRGGVDGDDDFVELARRQRLACANLDAARRRDGVIAPYPGGVRQPIV